MSSGLQIGCRKRLISVQSLFFVLVLAFQASTAQQFEWAQSVSGLGLDVCRAVTTDSQGNVIVVGSFNGSAQIGGVSISGDGLEEAFIAKFNSNGTLLWTNVISGPGEDLARGVVTDSEDNIYVVGHFTDTVTFNVSESDTAAARSQGGQDVFIAKYAPDGYFLWHLTGGGPEDDTATDIDWSPWAGKLYVSGGFQGRAQFGTAAILSTGLTDAFLLQIDGFGNAHWVQSGGGSEHDVGAAVSVDKVDESVYLVGDYYQTANFSGIQLTSQGSSDTYLAKYNVDGELIWVRSNGGTNVDVATGVSTDLNGLVYVAGYFQLTTVFGDLERTALGYNDVFLAQFDADGNCNWLSSAGSNALDNCLGLDVAWDGTAYLTGMFENEMFADGESFVGDGYDVFVLCYSSSGTLRYGRAAGAGSSDFGMATCLGPDESLYLAGYYFFFADFDNTTLGIAENGDGFLAKLTGVLETVYHNPTTVDKDPAFVSFYDGYAALDQKIDGRLLAYDTMGKLILTEVFKNGELPLQLHQLGNISFLVVLCKSERSWIVKLPWSTMDYAFDGTGNNLLLQPMHR